MRYNHFSMLPDRAFQKRAFGGMTLEGGGGGGGPTQTNVTQTNIPEWLRPQTEALLGAATKEYFQTREVPGKAARPAVYDGEGNVITPAQEATDSTFEITGVKPFTPYSTRPSDYFAGFSPLQQQVQFEAANMQRPEGFEAGMDMTAAAGMGGFDMARLGQEYGGAGYDIGQLGQRYGTQLGGRYGERGAGYGAAAAGLAGTAEQYGAEGAGFGRMGAMMAPEAQRYGRLGAGFGTQAAGLAPEAQLYGSRAADIGEMGLRAETLGRDVGAEARQFARQAAGMGGTYEKMATDPQSIQAYMSPYMKNVVDAQKEAAILNAKKATLGANLAAGRKPGALGGSQQTLATAEKERALLSALTNIEAQGTQKAFEDAQRAQQFGVTTGLQGLQGAQAGLGTALQGGQLGLSGIGQAIAGQQAGMQGLGQAGSLYGLGMQGAGMGLQGLGQAGQLYGMGMQGTDAALRGLGQAGQLYGTGITGAQAGLSGVDRMLAGTGQGMQGAQLGLSGVDRSLAGYNLGASAGRSMADISNLMQGADINRMRFQGDIGGLEQAREQAIINQAIQNYAQGEQTPFERLSGYNALLRGYATPTTTTQSYMAPPSPMSQVAGAGTSLYALSQMMGKKKGGKIKEKHGAGIDDLMIQKTMKKVAA